MTFQDLALRFPQRSRTKLIFQDFPGPGNFTNTIPGLSGRCGNPALINERQKLKLSDSYAEMQRKRVPSLTV